MTQKRKHFLDRMIRKEYKQFETMLIGKNNSLRIISQLFNLLMFKIDYLYDANILDYEEVVFMKQCNMNYMYYYHKMVAQIYDNLYKFS